MKIGCGKKVRIILNDLFLAIYFLFSLFSIASCSSSTKEELFFNGSTMGTSYSIRVVEPFDKDETKSFDIEIDSLLTEVNNKMSTYKHVPSKQKTLF